MKPKVKIKKEKWTLSNWIPQDSNAHKIFNKLSSESKNIFNHYLFCFNIFEKCKRKIYEDVVLNFPDKITINTFIENRFEYYYLLYSANYEIIKKNNRIIYDFINKQKLSVLHYNINSIINNLTIKCLTLDGIQFNEENMDICFNDVIENIIRSFYNKNYFKTKNDLLNKKELAITDKDFLKHVKNDKYLFYGINNSEFVVKLYYNGLKKQQKTKTKKKTNNLLRSERNIIRKVALKMLYKKYPMKTIPGDIIINIMDKAYQSVNSYISLKALGKRANKPNFLKPDERFIIPFYSKSFKVVSTKHHKLIRLTVGDEISKNYSLIIGKDLHQQKKGHKYIYDNKYDGSYLYVKNPKNKKYPLECLKLIEICPRQNGYQYKINYVFTPPTQNKKQTKHPNRIKDMISIDLGVKNLMAIYDPTGRQRIMSGGLLINTNEFYIKKIGQLQEFIDTHKDQNYTLAKNLVQKLLIKRENKLETIFNIIVSKLYNLYKNKKTIVFGYNENWKQNVNLGKNTNRKFCSIPYKKLLNKIRYKFTNSKVIEVAEYYTSKCDALALESIEKHEKYLGRRIKRGLFSSSQKKLLNADINGAINIMRRYCINKNIPFTFVNGINICNPIKLKYNP